MEDLISELKNLRYTVYILIVYMFLLELSTCNIDNSLKNIKYELNNINHTIKSNQDK